MIPDAAELVRRSWERTQVIGHRGAAASHPENTLESFEAAIRAGAAATECDVRLTSDGQAIVIHDATLDRTTPLTGRVEETEWAVLAAAGVPSLEEVIQLARGRAILVIEIKAGDGVEAIVARHLEHEGTVGQSIAFAFDPQVIERVKRSNPSIICTWLCAELDPHEDIQRTLESVGADGLGVAAPFVTPRLAAFARHEGIPLFAWTVPPGPEIDRLAALRLNFIITDHPSEVLAQLKRREV